jgi:hypothetical protein
LKRKKLIKFFSIIIIFNLLSCINRERETYKEYKLSDISVDSSGLYVTYKNSVFCVPSPQLINLYLKRLGIYPVKSAINPISNIEKYTTTIKKAINFGVYGADLGYMNIFSVSESTNDYVAAVSQLAIDLNLGTIFTREVYEQILALKNDQDSLAHYLSGKFTIANEYMKENSRQQTGALIIAGGWVESFYLLCFTYSQYKLKEIKDLLFQQKFVLDNLIKGLAPYYESSSEMQELVDNLVEIAYDFDLLDFKYSYATPIYKNHKGIVSFSNECQVLNSSESLENIIKKVEHLRMILIS